MNRIKINPQQQKQKPNKQINNNAICGSKGSFSPYVFFTFYSFFFKSGSDRRNIFFFLLYRSQIWITRKDFFLLFLFALHFPHHRDWYLQQAFPQNHLGSSLSSFFLHFSIVFPAIYKSAPTPRSLGKQLIR